MKIALQVANLAAALTFLAGLANADPIITIVYDMGAGITTDDMTQIQNAVNFYTSNITSTFSVTIAVGSVAGGGAQTSTFSDTVDYLTYYNALLTHSSGNATDLAAIASLGGSSSNNPVTSTMSISLRPTLEVALGIGSQISSSFSGCGGLTADACIQVGTNVLTGGPGGSPNGSLYGTFQHEFDEVLGTSSALRGSAPLPADPSAADLYRYSAPGTRSFALNTSTSVPCSGTPTAYLSVDGGATSLNQYNNCNNGGDYGDWIGTSGTQVQDAFGPDDVPSSLSLNSPEVTLLDAVGYNFGSTSAVPEPTSFVLLLTGLAAIPVLRRRFATKPRP